MKHGTILTLTLIFNDATTPKTICLTKKGRNYIGLLLSSHYPQFTEYKCQYNYGLSYSFTILI